MNKKLNISLKVTVITLIAAILVGLGIVFIKRDVIVTSSITMNYFEDVVNNYNKEKAKTLVAKSNNDVMYNNFTKTIEQVYYINGVSDFKFEIVDKEVLDIKKQNKHQCYFTNKIDSIVPECEDENEGRYMNYIIDINISYKLNNEEKNIKEKGLVSFVKDMSEGNYFTWKLVRFDRYKIVE